MKNSENGRNIGYARVSLSGMNEARQTDRLRAVCDKVYVEKVSGAAKSRPVFEKVLKGLKAGDALVVLDLDRAFRSTIDALVTMEALKARGVNLKILSLNLDLSTEFGEVVFGILAALAQFERRIISRRTKEGLAAARRRGVTLGRPRKLDEHQILEARRSIAQDNMTVADMAARYGVSRPTVRRGVKRPKAA
ncbi:MAG: recombinase family protein [Robiginitomaculum sp.]|nr:recombinase family protein [Robiginitomaculum sp.]